MAELDHLSAQPEFWNDQNAAQEFLKERTQLKEILGTLDRIETGLDDSDLMLEMADEEADALKEANSAARIATRILGGLEFQRMLGGPHDKSACFVSVNPGAGGTESQDWASMLYRMLLRFAERKGWRVEITDEQDGEEAGIKSATFRVEGDYAFGHFKAENGVHRLVRISPFDSNKRRHTSFASISVLPEIDDDIEVEINESELRVDTYRSSGAGGQHVNKTDSAVRLTHMPTGIVVTCQAERSQHKNRATAMKLLKSKLFELELEKRTEERDKLYAGRAKIDFGSQIRSYVLHPYQMVKDLRTNHETSDTKGVLDGDLNALIESFLIMHSGEV